MSFNRIGAATGGPASVAIELKRHSRKLGRESAIWPREGSGTAVIEHVLVGLDRSARYPSTATTDESGHAQRGVFQAAFRSNAAL